MCDPHALLTAAALRARLIGPGDALNPTQVDFATEIVTLCARIVDRFPDPSDPEDTVGDVLRRHLFTL
jgi:hypothetical protein